MMPHVSYAIRKSKKLLCAVPTLPDRFRKPSRVWDPTDLEMHSRFLIPAGRVVKVDVVIPLAVNRIQN